MTTGPRAVEASQVGNEHGCPEVPKAAYRLNHLHAPLRRVEQESAAALKRRLGIVRSINEAKRPVDSQ